jgi:hypothetical protein
MCLRDATTSAFGERSTYLSAVRLKKSRFGRTGHSKGDITVRDVMSALEKSPFYLDRVHYSFEQLVYRIEVGIFLCLFSFLHPDTLTHDKHYLVIDCERQIILDSSETKPISFLGLTPKQTMKAISCSRLERVWQVRVSLKRRGETHYI